ncbi:HD domain-containing phosphohydrolase [Rhodoferax sp. UBA5149]|uniref:HD domain-containing phosphohydrolase n=1 Tax=Rhodoferax sp. UBA5149 TaxID=1947379 RepID=UPI0025DEFFDD|nr:HD domain-containing phosphohydrolase [Rhodoferax sp. UBA5149]
MTEPNPVTDTGETKLPTILCVDDEPNILSSLRRLFRTKGFQVRIAEGGKAGLTLLETETVDLVISDMRMPEMDGAQFLEQVRSRWPDTVRLLLTGYSDITSVIEAINRGEIYRYITKPWDDNDIVLIVRQALERKALELEKKRLEALSIRQNEELKALNASLEAKVEARTAQLSVANDSLQSANEKLKTSFVTSIKVFSTLIEMRGGNLSGHSRRVADLSRRIAQKLQLDSKQVQEIFVAGLLHEIGKVGFADELLSTPVAMMKPPQMDAYRKHAVQAEQLLLPLQDLRGASEIISAQFERFDGTGFPERLAEDKIPIGARILTLASDFDNMQIGTLTQRHLTPEEARIIIVHSSCKRYDPNVVTAFVEVLGGASREEAEKERISEMAVIARDLQVGMVLSRDLITPNGLLMLSADHVLDARIISRIINFEKSGGMQLIAYILQGRKT